MIDMRSVAQFNISKEGGEYIASGVDLAIVTNADSLDKLMENIREAMDLYLEGEDLDKLDFSRKPSIMVNFEVPNYAN